MVRMVMVAVVVVVVTCVRVKSLTSSFGEDSSDDGVVEVDTTAPPGVSPVSATLQLRLLLSRRRVKFQS